MDEKRQSGKRVLRVGSAEGTPLGTIWLALSEAGLAAVEIGGAYAEFAAWLEAYYPGRQAVQDEESSRQAAEQMAAYLQGRLREFTLPVDWSGMGPFQRQALQATLAIPYGATRTYAQVAAQIGRPRAARAVGRAEATNPMPLVIPCHRVVGADGKLHGYGAPGGIKTKAWLLEMEAQQAGNSPPTLT
ncbi:MAG: methylated-DNA--[protein]-cysteine S-methyltransferase [Chloroflexi bacterium]|nr:methylated-DNA--[protein]-cysteine S-methyltransferase [Chloroflexota bacterium]